MKILILFGHPAFEKSNYNKAMVEGIGQLDNVTFRDLYEIYPEMDIERDVEQKVLEEHDCIIFHHPMYWYSAPAIFKEWQDLVLTHGWAYGSKGTALKGKCFFNAITTGAPRLAFNIGEYQNHTVREFLLPYNQMACLCKMQALPPFVIHGTHIVEEERLQASRDEYHRVLKHIAAGELDFEKVSQLEYLNEILEDK